MEIMLTGYAMLPKGITATKMYGVVAVAVKIDKKSGVIIDFECSLTTELAKKYIKELVVGNTLKDFEEIKNVIDKHYYGSAQKAIVTAIKSCSAQYFQLLNS